MIRLYEITKYVNTRNQIDIFSYKTSGLQKCLFIVDVRCVGFKPKILFVVCRARV